MANEEKQYIIKESQVKSILEYLYEKPFKEVAVGVQMLSNLEELKEDTKENGD